METEHGEGIASEVHSKGRGAEYAARALEFFLREIGAIGGCILQHDPEDAVAQVCKELAERYPNIEVRKTPRKSSQSNGQVEN